MLKLRLTTIFLDIHGESKSTILIHELNSISSIVVGGFETFSQINTKSQNWQSFWILYLSFKYKIQTYNKMLMTILSLVLEPNTYSILIKNVESNTKFSTGINVNKQTKNLNLGLVLQPWIKT